MLDRLLLLRNLKKSIFYIVHLFISTHFFIGTIYFTVGKIVVIFTFTLLSTGKFKISYKNCTYRKRFRGSSVI